MRKGRRDDGERMIESVEIAAGQLYRFMTGSWVFHDVYSYCVVWSMVHCFSCNVFTMIKLHCMHARVQFPSRALATSLLALRYLASCIDVVYEFVYSSPPPERLC